MGALCFDLLGLTLFTGLVLLSGSVHENVNGLKLADKN
jgi:hypothetical protein